MTGSSRDKSECLVVLIAFWLVGGSLSLVSGMATSLAIVLAPGLARFRVIASSLETDIAFSCDSTLRIVL